MTKTDKLWWRKEGRVGTVTFNNPERHNAVSLEMWEALGELLEQAERDADVRVLVLTGAGGKAFVSGADISKFEDERATAAAVARYGATTERIYSAVQQFPKPTLAMIRGYCIGGGLGLALSCDLRICSDDSRFALPAAKLGLGYDLRGLRRLVEAVGPAFTKEILYTARQFSAAEACEMGLVNRVVASADLESQVKDYADGIASNAPLTVDAVKFIVGQLLKDESERDVAACADRVKRCFESRDYAEGRLAFLEKRKPVFSGS
jgi:enoyl-CoA hydratase